VDEPNRTLPEIIEFGERYEPDHGIDLRPLLTDLFAYMPDPRAVQLLVERAREESEELSDELTEALVRAGAHAVGPLLELRSQLGDATSEIDFLLATLGVRDDRILNVLLEGLHGKDPTGAAFLLGIYGDPDAGRPLSEAMERYPEDARVFESAISNLSSLVAKRVDDEAYALWKAYPEIAEPDWSYLPEAERLVLLRDSAEEAHRLWAAIGFDDVDYSDEAKDVLLRQAEADASVQVRSACWTALGASLDDERVLEAMRSRLGSSGLELDELAALTVAITVVDGDNPRVREAIPKLYAHPETRAEAIEAMWTTLDRAYTPFIEKHLEDEDPHVRRQAIVGAGYLRLQSEAPRLEKWLNDPDWREEALFSYALAAPGETSTMHVRKLYSRIEDLAGGLELDEPDVVKKALDMRLRMSGRRALYFPEDDEGHSHEQENPEPAISGKVGRNDPCPCGSGKKYKKCCGG
jgi:hypothetical protein